MSKEQLTASFMAMIKEATKGLPSPISSLRGKDLFLRYVELHEQTDRTRKLLSEADIDLSNFLDGYYGMIKCMMCLAFSPAQVETIEWWLYESVEKVISWPVEGREWRLDSPEQLWDYLQTSGNAESSEASPA